MNVVEFWTNPSILLLTGVCLNTGERNSQEVQYRENFRNTLFAQSSSEYVLVESNCLYGLLSIKYVQTGNHEESIRGVEFNT